MRFLDIIKNCNNKAVLLLSGYNQRAVIAFLRVCTKYNIPFYIIASGKDDSILNTIYKDKVAYIREENDITNIITAIAVIKEKYTIQDLYFIPSTEYLNRFLLLNKQKLRAMNVHIPLVDNELYHKISDKSTFYQMCCEHGIPVPTIYQDIEGASFPCYLKSKTYEGYLGKPIKLKDKQSFYNIPENVRNDMFIEQSIEGNSYYLLYYFRKDGTYLKFSQRNIIQQKHGGSICLATTSNLHDTEITKKYVNMFIAEGFHGLVMVEVKEFDGIYYMIEANPRLWGPSQFFVDACVPFFEEYLKDMGFSIEDRNGVSEDSKILYYYWENGIIDLDLDVTYYNYAKDRFIRDYPLFKKDEIYRRSDTMNINHSKKISTETKERIINYYSDGSKHSNYQNFPTFVSDAIGITAKIDENWRGDSKRYEFITDKIAFQPGNIVGDVGANTGRFCLDFANTNPLTKFIAIEINEYNANFIKMIREIFDINNIEVINKSAGLRELVDLPDFDIAFHMNVLHHSGVDFDKDLVQNLSELKDYIIQYLSALREKCKTVIFQLGYNWGGNKSNPIVPPDNIIEMINYQKDLFSKSGYCIKNMGLYHFEKKVYIDVDSTLSDNGLQIFVDNFSMLKNSEFYKRPLFILERDN